MKLIQMVSIKKYYLALVFMIFSQSLYAGGAWIRGHIDNIEEIKEGYLLKFTQIDTFYELEPGCKSFEVYIRYERVPWYSWIPGVYTSHPSKKENIKSINYLIQKNKQYIYFGYMGSGLMPTDQKCSFRSKGLEYHQDNGEVHILSYHEPV